MGSMGSIGLGVGVGTIGGAGRRTSISSHDDEMSRVLQETSSHSRSSSLPSHPLAGGQVACSDISNEHRDGEDGDGGEDAFAGVKGDFSHPPLNS